MSQGGLDSRCPVSAAPANIPCSALDGDADRLAPGRIEDDRLYAAYHLIALRGFAPGEAAGLRWCDVDLEGKTAVTSQIVSSWA
jgi:hypothetical protein